MSPGGQCLIGPAPTGYVRVWSGLVLVGDLLWAPDENTADGGLWVEATPATVGFNISSLLGVARRKWD